MRLNNISRKHKRLSRVRLSGERGASMGRLRISVPQVFHAREALLKGMTEGMMGVIPRFRKAVGC